MGTDIHGWLEHGYDLNNDGEPDYWVAGVNDKAIFSRSYGFFGSFFGVRNYAEYEPIAADRGLPEDPSSTVNQQFPDGFALDPRGGDTEYHSHTWFRLDESIPWQGIPRLAKLHDSNPAVWMDGCHHDGKVNT